MRIHSIHHVPFEGLGAIKDWLTDNQFEHTATWLHQGDSFPSQDDFDALIIMGGPMSVHDEKEFLWLALEKEFIRKATDSGKPVLGFCLGGQLIAQVLGANVKKAEHKEIGWFPIENHQQTVLRVTEPFQAFHWHGETFDIPQQAKPLWYSIACPNQGFVYNNVLAVQCHFEMTEQTVKGLIERCSEDMRPGVYVQTEELMLSSHELFQESQAFLFELLDAWIAGFNES